MNGADNEVRGKDGYVPRRHEAHAEVPRHDAVHGDEHRQDEGREQDARDALQLPLPRVAVPAERQDAVDRAAPAGAAVADDGKVRYQRGVYEQRAGREVGDDGTVGSHTSGDRTSGQMPRAPVVGEYPVEDAPRPARV